MDLLRVNIILLSNASICFFDWAYAGFFPWFFEISCFQQLLNHEGKWFEFLSRHVYEVTPEEDRLLSLVALPVSVSSWYSYVSPGLTTLE
jgi:hypothetical protein